MAQGKRIHYEVFGPRRDLHEAREALQQAMCTMRVQFVQGRQGGLTWAPDVLHSHRERVASTRVVVIT